MGEPTRLPDAASLAFVEGLLLDFLEDPASVAPEWREYFGRLGIGAGAGGRFRRGPAFRPRGLFDPGPADGGAETAATVAAPAAGAAAPAADAVAVRQDRVVHLIRSYLVRGHMAARLDPLGRPRPPVPELDPAFHGLGEADLERRFATHGMPGAPLLPLREILERLRAAYCRSIGVQFMHIDDPERRTWLRERLESPEHRIELPPPAQLRILSRLTDAAVLEEFIQQKYPGAKSFSLEGAESLIPLLDLAIETAAEHGVEEIVLGMAHRGRLNVLVNILGKSPGDVFHEFEDRDPGEERDQGDVKYHLGYSTDWVAASGRTVHLSLCFNPSHLEFVDPVAVGRLRAKQDRVGDAARRRGMVLLIHGDAAFAGEGVVQETLNLSRLDAYRTGGSLHVVVNNQIGFTTPPEEAYSSPYATDVARMLQVPVFHVNGEDPEAVARVVRIGMEFRRAFQSDVILDMYCYRRRGHNEGDEPAFTQPLMYRVIEARPSVRESYLERLAALGVSREAADRIAVERRAGLEQALAAAREPDYRPRSEVPTGVWRGYRGGPEPEAEVATGVEGRRLAALLEAMTRLPEGFRVHPKVTRGLARRREMADGRRPVDWSTAEALAFATLATQGHRVRLSGQDTARGTFSHRHAVLHDVEDGAPYAPLAHLAPDQAPVEVINSPLSEVGCLGFEYGYSLDCPEGLVAWEAQFGDFVNAAQVIVDQFLVSAEEKWRRLSGLVLLLPHGFEGQGPEHSSARLERFLNLAVDDNIQVVNPSTPAQYFHLLRRQVLREWRKPLVVMTPKSLLRHPMVVSRREELEGGTFRRILPDPAGRPDGTARILLCSGKIYYELAAAREQARRDDVAILRLEQLYPVRDEHVAAALEGYPAGVPVVWVQEEPANMGAWRHLAARFGDGLPGGRRLSAVCRAPSASPATGSSARHKREQRRLIEEALGPA